MKKLNLLFVFVISSLLLATACSNGPNYSENNDYNSNNDGPKGTKATKGTALTFNMGSLNALAIASNEDDRSATRSAARSASTDGMIVKILEDGSVQDFINVPSNIELAPVSYIAQSPDPDAKEIYIVFDYTTYWGENIQDEDGYWHWEQRCLGQLLCVNEDGTYYDILEQENGTYKWLYGSSKDSISFDHNGGMYYLVSESSGNSNTNMIYKFDAATGTSITLTQAINNTYYNKIQVSNDGKWIFAQANRWTGKSDTRYLRAIPTESPENFINLFYSSTNNSWINDWCYDDDTQTIYYIQDGNLFAIPLKDGTFDKQNKIELFSNNSGASRWFYWDSLLTYSSNYTTTWQGVINDYDYDLQDYKEYYFRDPANEETLRPANIFNYLLSRAYASISNKSEISWSDFKQTYEIRFDKFKNINGYESLATLTQGKSDTNLIKATIDNHLEEMLYNLFDDEWYSCANYFPYFYNHNFFADILYEKGTNKSIPDSYFSKQVYDGVEKFNSNNLSYINLFTRNYEYGYNWKKDFKNEDGTVNAEKVLKELADYCGKKQIDFSLKTFKDNSKYGLLYSELTNEEAIEFLSSPARISKLADYFNDNDNYDNYNGYGKFLLETCFEKESDFATPAYKWRQSSNDSIWWGGVSNLTTSYKSSLYGIYSNGNSGFGLIRIIDENGNKDGSYVDAFTDYKISELISSTNGFYFKNSLLDQNDEETGNHQIQYYDVIEDKCTNLFDNVTDKTELEVISFTAGDDCIYYSAAKGFTIINGKIDIATKAATVLSTNTKLTQIIVIK